jgi:hypothetical protein
VLAGADEVAGTIVGYVLGVLLVIWTLFALYRKFS